jgi:glucosylceramidase
MKHLSHFVKPNAKRVNTAGAFDNLLAFVNPDKSIAILVHNDSNEVKNVTIKIGDTSINPSLQPNTINTFLLK